MKKTSTLQKARLIGSLCICIGVLTTHAAFASGKPYRSFNTVVLGGEEDVLKKDKSIFLRNNNSVKIYLDEPQKKVHVIAKENKGKEIDFFVFDLEGTLVHNHKMKTKDHHRVTNLSKGVYVYRVFCGDEETAYGQFEIK